MSPPSGPNLICKNPPLPVEYNQSEPRRVSEKCQSLSYMLLAAPFPHAARTLQRSSPTQCLLLPGQILSCTNRLQWRRIDNNNRKAEICTTFAHVKENNKKTGEEKQCKKKELDRAREKTRIKIGSHFRGGGS